MRAWVAGFKISTDLLDFDWMNSFFMNNGTLAASMSCKLLCNCCWLVGEWSGDLITAPAT